MDELTQLAIKYGADKWGKHNYTPVYYEIFKKRRNEVKKVLEVGVAEGASLFMWRDFFPNALVYGADNDLKRVINLANKEPIRVYPCDQSSEEDLLNLINETGGDIDLIVDDGSHRPTDQINTCLALMEKLDYGAIYVIEDVANPKIFTVLKNKFALMDCKMIKLSERYDDRLIIIKK